MEAIKKIRKVKKGHVMSGSPLNMMKDFSFEIFFSTMQSWVQKNHFGLIKIGITDLFRNRNKNVFAAVFAGASSVVKTGDKIFQIKVDNKVIDIVLPFNCVVKFINPNFQAKKISDNFGDDWIILLAADNSLDVKTNLPNRKDYLKSVTNSFNKYQKD